MTENTKHTHTPHPWKWKGEDYRGGWGWQLLVGKNGEGILCGEENARTSYRHLRGFMPIEPKYCETGFLADEDSAPCVHIRKPDADLILMSPEMLEELEECRIILGATYMWLSIEAQGIDGYDKLAQKIRDRIEKIGVITAKAKGEQR